MYETRRIIEKFVTDKSNPIMSIKSMRLTSTNPTSPSCTILVIIADIAMRMQLTKSTGSNL